MPPRLTTSPPRIGLALLMVLVLAPFGVLSTWPAEAATPATSSAHPYGDPVWFPLRSATSIGCAKSGCGTSADHGYWALDFIGERGTGVYAAGAGVVHVGGTSGSCVASSASVSNGRWVWVDHGGGVVSRYHHLGSIAVHEGELVTPATRLGTVGSSGDRAPCTTAYLHFEVRHGGLNGTRVDPGSLAGCTSSGQITLPDALGVASWDDPRLHPKHMILSPTLDSGCISATWLSTPAQLTPTVRRTNKAVTVSVAALPADVTSWQARLDVYHPTTKRWSETYRAVSASSLSTTFVTDNTHAYRAYVSARNGAGWSVASARTNAVGAPAAPASPRFLTWPKKDYVHYGWSRSDNLGAAVTSYDVARRCSTSTSGAFGGWTTYRQGASSIYRNLRGLSSMRRCEVKVRGVNAIGAGPWSTTSTVRR